MARIAGKHTVWPALRTAALVFHPSLGLLDAWRRRRLRRVRGRGVAVAVSAMIAPLRWCSGPVAALTFGHPLLRLLAPSALRTLRFYEHIMPIFWSYLVTIVKEQRGLKGADLEAVWDARHEEAASATAAMLVDLSGFYLKVGQVFATKQDLFPPQYIRKLRYLPRDESPVQVFRPHCTC